MARDIKIVIAAVVKAIPEEIKQYNKISQMLRELEACRERACFYAPEMMPGVWAMGSDALARGIGVPETDWQKRVQSIWLGDNAPQSGHIPC